MGAYVYPSDITKEEWLSSKARLIQHIHEVREGEMLVVLFFEDFHPVARIAYREGEAESFTTLAAPERVKLFAAKVSELLSRKVSDLSMYYP